MEMEKLKEFEHIFYPRTVAVIGASQEEEYTHAYMSTKMRDNLFLVNPKYKEILGKRCYASLLDIEEDIDYITITVAASLVPKILGEAIEKGVKLAHIFTAGFSESGMEERIRLENEIKEIAKGKIRLIGPNGMGIYCPQSGLSFNKDSLNEEGSVGVISQSGTFAQLFFSVGKVRNMRFSKAISYGNAIDLDCPDFLEYLADDPKTKVIALYIEGTRNGKRLKLALEEAVKKKPVVVLKGGVTKGGGRVALSHTGSLGGSPEIWSSLFRQTGVIQAANFDELFSTVLAFTCCPLPAGKGVSIVTNSGGYSVIKTDACIKAGLEVPPYDEETAKKLRKIIPIPGASIGNPLDSWHIYASIYADTSEIPGTITDVIDIIANDKNIHSLVLHFSKLKYLARLAGEGSEKRSEKLLNTMLSECQYVRDELGKPVMICISIDTYSEDEEDRRYHLLFKKAFESRQFPVYESLDASIKALHNLYRYSTWLRNK